MKANVAIQVFTTALCSMVMCVPSVQSAITVNSLSDSLTPGAGEVTLRTAVESAAGGEVINFDPVLDGQTIELTIVGEEHSILKGEVMGMTNAPSGPVSYLVGYFDRDYGRSALYAQKNIVIDASALTHGITVKWMGGDADPARVLAVYGDLTLKNVSVVGGRSVAIALPDPDPEDEYAQLSTRARGGALAVWGVAALENCRLYDNKCSRDGAVPARSRDAGVFGGGIYADIVEISDSVISGNELEASGVSGGGVFSVGGADTWQEVSLIERSSITGNKIAGIFTYGGGVYTDGGGIGKMKTLRLVNCTIADNLVGIWGPGYLYGIGYWRGGGVYMSNGLLDILGCTIVNNQVHGVARTNELDKPNMAGGIAATIGNAHAAENMAVGQSIIAGNTVHEYGATVYYQDIFAGSLQHFFSTGFNRIGVLEFSQILVPVGEPDWFSLCRRHFPNNGDQAGVSVSNVVELSYGVTEAADILSVGVNAGSPAVLQLLPKGDAVDRIDPAGYNVDYTFAEYAASDPAEDDFLEIMLARIESQYSLSGFATNFTANFEAFLATVDLDDETAGKQPYTDPDGVPILTLADTAWFGPAVTWPSLLENYPYIEFWHQLDAALLAEGIPGLGQALLNDEEWDVLFDAGYLSENPGIYVSIWEDEDYVPMLPEDQNGVVRSTYGPADIGAVEYPYPEVSVLSLDGIIHNGSNAVVRWNSNPTNTYALWEASNLISNDWQILDSAIDATAPFNLYTTAVPHAVRFYTLEIE